MCVYACVCVRVCVTNPYQIIKCLFLIINQNAIKQIFHSIMFSQSYPIRGWTLYLFLCLYSFKVQAKVPWAARVFFCYLSAHDSYPIVDYYYLLMIENMV